MGSYYDSSANSAKIEGQTLTLPINVVESDSETKIGTITVIIHTQNFEDMTATIDVRSVNKIIPTGGPTLSAATLTYGQPLSTITLRGDMANGAEPVPGKFEWSSPSNRPAVQQNYAAAWTFKPDDNNKYVKYDPVSQALRAELCIEDGYDGGKRWETVSLLPSEQKMIIDLMEEACQKDMGRSLRDTWTDHHPAINRENQHQKKNGRCQHE
ncbi:hypothetical protein AALC17_18920 [Oscillospiraceae bacterium 38-13]